LLKRGKNVEFHKILWISWLAEQLLAFQARLSAIKFHIEEVHTWYRWPNVIMMINSRPMRDGQVTQSNITNPPEETYGGFGWLRIGSSGNRYWTFGLFLDQMSDYQLLHVSAQRGLCYSVYIPWKQPYGRKVQRVNREVRYGGSGSHWVSKLESTNFLTMT
jgi:hypothetical protein